ncbi:MAG: TMEM175 family protein [Chakrabartia sp.]
MTSISKERIGAISDGVIAVAATLLVIDLEVPDGVTMTNELVFHWSRVFAAWIISFIMIVAVWLDNHLFLSKARDWSVPLTILTFLQLGAVSLIPFASDLVIDHYESQAAMLTFNAVLMLNGIASYAICRTLVRGTAFLDDAQAADALHRRGQRQLIIYALVLVLASTAGYLQHPMVGIICWALSPILISLTARFSRTA